MTTVLDALAAASAPSPAAEEAVAALKVRRPHLLNASLRGAHVLLQALETVGDADDALDAAAVSRVKTALGAASSHSS